LQALLNMLRKELESFGSAESDAAQLAGVVDVVASVAGENSAVGLPSEEVARQQPSDGRRSNEAKSSPPAAKPGARGWKRKRGR
jgi:hypothetical protein